MIKLTVKFLVCLILISSSHAFSSSQNHYLENSLCSSDDTVLSNVVLDNDKVVSFCGKKKGQEEDELWVQYKYGTQDNVEMMYPNTESTDRNVIYYVDESGGSVNEESVFFYVGNYRYTYKYITSNVLLTVDRKLQDGKWESIFYQKKSSDFSPSWFDRFPDRKYFKVIDRHDYWNGDW